MRKAKKYLNDFKFGSENEMKQQLEAAKFNKNGNVYSRIFSDSSSIKFDFQDGYLEIKCFFKGKDIAAAYVPTNKQGEKQQFKGKGNNMNIEKTQAYKYYQENFANLDYANMGRHELEAKLNSKLSSLHTKGFHESTLTAILSRQDVRFICQNRNDIMKTSFKFNPSIKSPDQLKREADQKAISEKIDQISKERNEQREPREPEQELNQAERFIQLLKDIGSYEAIFAGGTEGQKVCDMFDAADLVVAGDDGGELTKDLFCNYITGGGFDDDSGLIYFKFSDNTEAELGYLDDCVIFKTCFSSDNTSHEFKCDWPVIEQDYIEDQAIEQARASTNDMSQEQLIARVGELEKKYKEAQDNAILIEERNLELEKQLGGTEYSRAMLDDEIKRLKEQAYDLRIKNGKLEIESNARINLLDDKLEEKDKRIAELEQQKKKDDEYIVELEEEKTEKFQQLKTEISILNETKQHNLNVYIESDKEKNKLITQLEQQVSELSNRLESIGATLRERNQEVKQLKEKLTTNEHQALFTADQVMALLSVWGNHE